MPSETEFAWAAGFIDGEGCWYCSPPSGARKTLQLRLMVDQVDPRPLERLQALFGLGRVRTTKLAHRWELSAWADVWKALLALWPYMSEPKREQAQLALLRFRAGVNGVKSV